MGVIPTEGVNTSETEGVPFDTRRDPGDVEQNDTASDRFELDHAGTGKRGQQRKVIAATACNDHSSRAHTVLIR